MPDARMIVLIVCAALLAAMVLFPPVRVTRHDRGLGGGEWEVTPMHTRNLFLPVFRREARRARDLFRLEEVLKVSVSRVTTYEFSWSRATLELIVWLILLVIGVGLTGQ